MRFRTIIFAVVFALVSLFSAHSQDEADTYAPADVPPPSPLEEPVEIPPESLEPIPEPQQPSPDLPTPEFQEGTGLDDEGLFEDALPKKPLSPEDKEKMTNMPKKLDIDAVVVIKYMFANTNESYSVKYHINMGGDINSDIGVIKGNAKIATDISGYLAKSSAFECLLKVSIADVPYEITFKKVSDTEANINVAFKGQILENWESLCTFLDTSGAKFNTRGSPELWIGMALEKTKPPLNKISTAIDPAKTVTTKFTIPKYSFTDEGLGTAEIEGTGVVTITPKLPTEKPEIKPTNSNSLVPRGLCSGKACFAHFNTF